MTIGATPARPPARPLVVLVDDDESVRESLPDLLSQLGYDAVAFASAEEFLENDDSLIDRAEGLILDVSMPGLSGPELHQELLRRGVRIPTIFITAHADSTVRPSLLAQGAIECLFNPFSEEALLEALQQAINK